MRAVFVSDLRHFLDLAEDTPAPAVRLAEQLRDVVRAATVGERGASWVSALPCRRHPGNRRCPGHICVRRMDVEAAISYECTGCGDGGLVSGWQDTQYDLRDDRHGVPVGTPIHFIVSEAVAASLRAISPFDADYERLAYGARTQLGRLVLTATDEQLEGSLGHLAAEARRETKRPRRRRLDIAYEQLREAAGRSAEPKTASPSDRRAGGPVAATTATPASAGLPDLDVLRVQRWCAARVPERARHQVRVECEVASGHVTIVERWAPWRDEAGRDWTGNPIARLRYAKTAKTWTLFWRDRDLRFHTYKQLPPSTHIDDLLSEVDSDPTCLFWG